MTKLNHILHSNKFYILLIIITFLYSIYFFSQKRYSKLDSSDYYFVGTITNIEVSGDLLKLEVDLSEKVIGYYYFKTLSEKEMFLENYNIGDTISIEGVLNKPKNNTLPNGFNYRKYLERKGIFYQLEISNIKKINNNKNLFYIFKNLIIKHINTYKSNSYLHTFILGNNNYLDLDIETTYQELGISHLFAISGMHISLFSAILFFILKKLRIKEIVSSIFIIVFLIFYMILLGSLPSVSRAVVLFALLTINKIFKLELSTIKIFIITFTILVCKNPFSLLEVGFQFSYVVSFYLILFSKKIKDKNYIASLIWVSFISFLVSFPISIYYFYQINLLSIFWNLIFVPFVSIFLFPLAILTFCIPFLDSIFYLLISVLENVSLWCNQFCFFKLIFGKPSLVWIFLYYFIVTILLWKKKKILWLILILLINYQYFHLLLFPKTFFIMIDVGQGDSLLVHSYNKTVIIDTGGKIFFSKEDWRKRDNKGIADTRLIPLLKSLGIKKLDYLVLTHGDYDHMGEAINLVNKFKVDEVIFNNGEYNYLELELIEILKHKGILYKQVQNELKIDKLYFLEHSLYDNENDNSSVIYLSLYGYQFLMMGDSSINVEKDILDRYNLKDIDFLKVGHHGSNTSSSKYFIDEINPKYSLISVGKNNRYSHPKDTVLDILSNSKIYRTDLDGSIVVRFSHSSYDIKSYQP